MASNHRIFFDANVLLETLLKREKDEKVSTFLLRNQNCMRAISALTGHLVVHFTPEEIRPSTIRAFINDFDMFSLTNDDFEWAFDNAHDDDFEDALQIAVAIRNGCDIFVTFDKKLAKNYGNLPTLKMKLLV